MDLTELHYLTYDPDAIWSEMQDAYIDAGGEALYPGDEKEMLLRSVQAVLVQGFAGIDNALRMATLRYAVGDYLDVIGEQRDCPRLEAVAAKSTVTIEMKAVETAGTLPAGTSMTADGVVFYSTTEDVPKALYAQTVTVGIACDRAGAVGNGLAAGTEMQLAQGDADVGLITVTEAATGGSDEEDDETYRARIREHGLANVTTGPKEQYEARAMEVSSDIVDANAVSETAGYVDVYLIVRDASRAASLVEAVGAALSSDDARPLTDHVTVSLASDVPYTLNVRYTQPSGASLAAAVAAAVEEYQAWQDDVIGQAFNPDRLMALLYQAGCTRVTWGNGCVFNGSSDIEYTEIGSGQRCKGTVTASVWS